MWSLLLNHRRMQPQNAFWPEEALNNCAFQLFDRITAGSRLWLQYQCLLSLSLYVCKRKRSFLRVCVLVNSACFTSLQGQEKETNWIWIVLSAHTERGIWLPVFPALVSAVRPSAASFVCRSTAEWCDKRHHRYCSFLHCPAFFFIFPHFLAFFLVNFPLSVFSSFSGFPHLPSFLSCLLSHLFFHHNFSYPFLLTFLLTFILSFPVHSLYYSLFQSFFTYCFCIFCIPILLYLLFLYFCIPFSCLPSVPASFIFNYFFLSFFHTFSSIFLF